MTRDQDNRHVVILHFPVLRDKHVGRPMTHLYPPGRCALEITPDDTAPQDPGAHARLTTPILSVTELDSELKAILAELHEIGPRVTALVPCVQRAAAEITKHLGPRDCKMDDILKLVAKHFGVTTIDIRSHRRTADIVRPRQVAMYLCRALTTRSYPDIARFLGGKDHTTIMHSVRVVAKTMNENAEFAQEVSSLANSILIGDDSDYQDR